MQLLVTGGTGRVGSRLVPRLLAWGYAVRAVVRTPDRAAALAAAGAEVVPGDLLDPAATAAAVAGVDAVVHVAATFREGDAEAVRRGTEEATLVLADAAETAGVRPFVFTSTNLVYGPGRGRPAREDDEPRPTMGPYPEAKVAAERALRERAEAGRLDLTVLRLALCYGDGDPTLRQVMRWARDWPAGRRVHLIHHADIAAGVDAALRTPGAPARVYNLADDAAVTAYELHQVNGETPAADITERPLDDPWEDVVDTSAIRSGLGFRPIHPTVYAARAAGAL